MRSFALFLSLMALNAREAMARGPYDALADQIARAAQRAGARQAQFVPLVNAAGKVGPEGRMMSAKLLKHIVDQNKVFVVLGDAPSVRAAPSDVLIQGSYLVVRDRIKVNVQVVAVPSGAVLLAADEDLKNEWPSAWPEFLERSPADDARTPAAAPSGAPNQPFAAPRPGAFASPEAAAFAAQTAQAPYQAPAQAQFGAGSYQQAAAPYQPAAAPPAPPEPAARPAHAQAGQWDDVFKPLTVKPKTAAGRRPRAIPISFSLAAPQAQTVQLSGGFLLRRHGGRMAMSRLADGTWTTTVYLTPGTYRYSFIVDGTQKIMDPQNPLKANGSSLLDIPEPAEL